MHDIIRRIKWIHIHVRKKMSTYEVWKTPCDWASTNIITILKNPSTKFTDLKRKLSPSTKKNVQKKSIQNTNTQNHWGDDITRNSFGEASQAYLIQQAHDSLPVAIHGTIEAHDIGLNGAVLGRFRTSHHKYAPPPCRSSHSRNITPPKLTRFRHWEKSFALDFQHRYINHFARSTVPQYSDADSVLLTQGPPDVEPLAVASRNSPSGLGKPSGLSQHFEWTWCLFVCYITLYNIYIYKYIYIYNASYGNYIVGPNIAKRCWPCCRHLLQHC